MGPRGGRSEEEGRGERWPRGFALTPGEQRAGTAMGWHAASHRGAWACGGDALGSLKEDLGVSVVSTGLLTAGIFADSVFEVAPKREKCNLPLPL